MHVHARDCPLTCLQPLISTWAYKALGQECSATAGPHPTIGDAADLCRTGELASVRGIGARTQWEIETALTNAGLTSHTATATPAPAERPEPPAAPGRPGRLRTRLLTE